MRKAAMGSGFAFRQPSKEPAATRKIGKLFFGYFPGFFWSMVMWKVEPELAMRRQKSCGKIGLLFGIALAAAGPCAAAQAWTESVLYAFKGGSDGAVPESTLIMDHHGNLYGTTFEGGGACNLNQGCGTVFKVAPGGRETVLYAFRGGAARDGSKPVAGLVRDADRNLYGTTLTGVNCGCGTVFKVTPTGAYTILHAFQRDTGGQQPYAGLATDGAGNLYGATAFDSTGGSCNDACGLVFKIAANGDYSPVYAFKGGTDGASPRATPVLDSAGNLYGTTDLGGTTTCNCGTVFKIANDGTESVLHAFRGGHDGRYPDRQKLLLDVADNLYGVTGSGGGKGCGGNGCGTIYRIAPDGTETILATFNSAGGPVAPEGIVMTGAGTFYGTAGGGAHDCGTIFRFVPGAGKPKTIYSFACGRDGADPLAGLVRGRDGTLYGTTLGGGNGFGVVFALRK